MNMFRDLAMLFCIFCGVALMVSNPLDWSLMARAPAEVSEAISFMLKTQPFSSIVFYALALALFMTRIKY